MLHRRASLGREVAADLDVQDRAQRVIYALSTHEWAVTTQIKYVNFAVRARRES